MKRRIVVLDRELCKPKKCSLLCARVCPLNRSGKECIVKENTFPYFNEEICIGCGICVKKCPMKAISLVNLPEELEEDPVHRYGKNAFSLYRLPSLKKGKVVGIIGENGTGKSTIIRILSGEITPSMGYDNMLRVFRGSEVFNYIKMLEKKNVSVAYKPQKVGEIPKVFSGKVKDLLKKADERGVWKDVMERLGIDSIGERDVKNISGGEAQLLAIAATLVKDRDFYFFDEPSSYLDVFQRFNAGKLIREMSRNRYVMVVEHDMALLDYLSDFVHVVYGKPGVFGVVSNIYATKNGINRYLEGFLREENVRFRKRGIVFDRVSKNEMKGRVMFTYEDMVKKYERFELSVEGGNVYEGEIIGILGRNGTGKTTFIKMLSGRLKPDKGKSLEDLNVSFKQQILSLSEKEAYMSVREFINAPEEKVKEVLRKFLMESVAEKIVGTLSGGELQCVFIAKALLEEHDVLFLDEPSAFLDVEQRLRLAKLLREHVSNKKVAIMVVDHDLQFLDFVSNRLLLFSGVPGRYGEVSSPLSLRKGMNSFLREVGITFRRDEQTGRIRANKSGSVKDREQKEAGEYFYEEI